YAEAEPLYMRSLAILEKSLGAEHPWVATSQNNLATLYYVQGRYTEAELLYKRSFAIREKVLGSDHPDVAASLNNIAALYDRQGRSPEAGPLYPRALAIREKVFGPAHPDVGQSLANLAVIALTQRNWAQAATYWRRATTVIERRAERGLAGSEEGSGKAEAVRNSSYFWSLLKMTDRLTPNEDVDRAKQGREMFEKAQWALASAARWCVSSAR